MMDSIKSFKGYAKVDEAEERSFRLKTRSRLIIISVSVIVLLTVILAALVGTLAHKNNTGSSSSTSSSPSTPAQSMKAVCSVTQYPESCFSSISSMESPSNKADPEVIFKLSLKAAMNELSKLTSLPDKFINKKSNGVESALIDCKILFDEAIDQLNSSISSMEVSPGEDLLSTVKINDIKTWLSSAITDQETCLDGLIEMNSAFVDQVKAAMKNATELTSNSLAIVTKILTILDDFNIPIHRKLLGRVDSDFPECVNPRDRKLLKGGETDIRSNGGDWWQWRF